MSDRLRMTSMIGIVTLLPLLLTPLANAQQTVIASDNFNRANESPLVVGGNWQRLSSGGTVNLTGNQIAGVSGDAVYYWQGAGTFGATEQFARARVTNAGGQVGLVLLGTGSSGLVASWGGGWLYIYWYSGGGYQGQLTQVPSTVNSGDLVEATLEAGTVSAKINGVVVASVPNTTTLTSGTPGFETYQAGANLDDWQGGTRASGGACAGSSNGTPCDDGSACTQVDTCQSGVCVGGGPVVCTPPDNCYTAGTCDPASGSCFNPPVVCNDNNNCTIDSCDPATGCVYKQNPNGCGNTCTTDSCDDGNPCTTDSCDAAGNCVHVGSDGPDNSCSKVTNSSLCALPTGLCGASPTGPQFRLNDLQDPTYSPVSGTTVFNDYRINASNPGQFYYNVFRAGTPGAALDLTINVPYPFVTQGSNPIQLHDRARTSGGCYLPGASLSGFTVMTDGGHLSPSGRAVILLSDYDVKNLGATTSVHVTGTVPASGLVYVTIHLDYGFKKVTGWQLASNLTSIQGPDTNLDGTPDGFGSGPITIASPQSYGFSFGVNGTTHSFSPSSCNKIKKMVGIIGNTVAAVTGDPVGSARVQLFGPTGTLLETTTSDLDGFYVLSYKFKGKAATYTVKLPEHGKQKSVTLKANGYARINFEDLLSRGTDTGADN